MGPGAQRQPAGSVRGFPGAGLLAALSWAGGALSTDLYQMLNVLGPCHHFCQGYSTLGSWLPSAGLGTSGMALSPREPPKESKGMGSTSPSPPI